MMNIMIVSWIIRMLVVLISKTIRIRNIGTIPKYRTIYAFWHSDFFPLVCANKSKNITVLISRHRDGEYLSRVIKPLGYNVIRGSSDEGGARGVMEILKLSHSGIAIAPDGPKGPANQVKLGVLKIAQLTQLPIVPVGVNISNKVVLGSWDRFKIPLPFTRCTIYWSNPIRVKEVDERTRLNLQVNLIKVNKFANKAGVLERSLAECPASCGTPAE